MSLTEEQRKIAVDLLIEKSNRNMQQALHNVDMGYWDLVANRLYYSMFHAVNAIMVKDGIRTGTHKGTSAMFGLHYVMSGKFSREDGILYSRLQTMREKADYQNTFTLTEEQGQELIAQSLQLAQHIIEYIKVD